MRQFCFSLIGIACWLIASTVVASADQPSDEDLAWFENKVRPILSEHCQSCHSHEVGKTSGGLSLDSREDLLQGGDSGDTVSLADPESSLMISAIRRESYEMPPEKPLPADQQAILLEWIQRGLPWPTYDIDPNMPDAWLHKRAAQHWAWKIRKNVEMPETPDHTTKVDSPTSVTYVAPLRTAIDHFIGAKLAELQLEAAPPLDALPLLRRISIDLTGLPPTVANIKKFERRLSELQDPKLAIEEVVNELLASPQFGAHWARHWLDLVRYAETMGHEFDYPIPEAWRYRDAVIDAINQDIPYDQFVQEHIAGDLVDHPRMDPQTGVNQSLAMTGWWWFGESVQAPVDVELDYATRLDNQIDVLSKTFFGMTVACARCHDHKFDAIAAADYYGLSGILQSSRRLLRPTDPHGKIAQFDQSFAARMAQADLLAEQHGLYQTATPTAIEEWFRTFQTKLASDPKSRDAIRSLDHPLAWLVPCTAPDAEKAWQDFRTTAKESQHALHRWRDESELLADFRGGVPAGWKVIADCNQQDTKRGQLNWLQQSLILPQDPNVFSSRRIGTRQQVILQSPEFLLPGRSISVLARGSKATSTVYVDGFFMLEHHQLLFGDMRKNFTDTTHKKWFSHQGNLDKYINHRAYLSFEDRDDGWFDIQEVRASNSPAPLHVSESVQAMIARFESVPSPQQIAAYLAEQISMVNEASAQTDLELLVSIDELCRSHQLPHVAELQQQVADQKKQLEELEQSRPAPISMIAIQEGAPFDEKIAIRGDPHQRGEIAPRGCFRETIPQDPIGLDSSGRLELANQMIDPQHPLTSRVIVNRVWAKLFGTGIVATPDNFGVLGGRPSHPELLDYLAKDFVGNGWSIKRLIRELVLSEAYQRSSYPKDSMVTADPESRWLSHRTIQRMTSESIRDSLLQFSGKLDDKLHGPSVAIHLTSTMTGRGRPGGSGPLDGANRRTIFVEVRRNFLNPFLVAFDTPLPSTTVGQRAKSNVPAQSLGMLNDPFVELMATRWVEKNATLVRSEELGACESLLETLFLDAFTRYPTPAELSICQAALRDHPDGRMSESAWVDLVMAIVNSKEFIFVR